MRAVTLALLAAVAGSAALGIAVLAAAGAHVCHHEVAALAAMPGMAMPAAAEASEGLCPILAYAAALAAALCLLASVALLGARARMPGALTSAARFLADQRLAPLTAALGLTGAVPLLAILALDGGLTGIPALAALGALVGGAFVSALALAAGARFALELARRLAVAFVAAFRLLVPGADAPWFSLRDPLLVPAGVRLARRRPSRAPPGRR